MKVREVFIDAPPALVHASWRAERQVAYIGIRA